MDAAARCLLWVCLTFAFVTGPAVAQEATVADPRQEHESINGSCNRTSDGRDTSSLHAFAQWVGQWMATARSISVRMAIPEMNSNSEPQVVTPCTTPRGRETIKPADEQPILEMPAAPPLPPSYQFTQHSPEQGSPLYDAAFHALGSA